MFITILRTWLFSAATLDSTKVPLLQCSLLVLLLLALEGLGMSNEGRLTPALSIQQLQLREVCFTHDNIPGQEEDDVG